MKINIVFICDSNYMIPTKVAINSLIKNKRRQDVLDLYVIGVELTEEKLQEFQIFQSEQITVKPVIPKMVFDDWDIVHQHVSKAALYKFMIPNMFPEVDKMLYLDGDMLVLKSLDELYNVDLDDHYAAVVKDMKGEKEFDLKKTTGVKNYFNSGMMLLNLKKLREDRIVEKLILDRKKDKNNRFMDQDSLNRVFDEKIVFVSPTYNYMEPNNCYPVEELAEYYHLSIDEAQEIQSAPTILHITNSVKPWCFVNSPCKSIWFSYLLDDDREEVLKTIGMREAARADSLLLDRRRINNFKEQYNSDYEYRKKGGFESDVYESNPFIKMFFDNKDRIKTVMSENEHIIIFGAGKVGRALYQCVWSFGMTEKVLGFAVTEPEWNLKELYGKKVELLNRFERKNVTVVIAFQSTKKDRSDVLEIINRMKQNGFDRYITLEQLIGVIKSLK